MLLNPHRFLISMKASFIFIFALKYHGIFHQ